MARLVASLAVIGSFTILFIQGCDRTTLPDVKVTPNVSFETHIKPITSTVCIQCHSGRGRNFAEYPTAYRNRHMIFQRVVVDRTMPAGKYMSNEDRALFRDWVNQGANK